MEKNMSMWLEGVENDLMAHHLSMALHHNPDCGGTYSTIGMVKRNARKNEKRRRTEEEREMGEEGKIWEDLKIQFKTSQPVHGSWSFGSRSPVMQHEHDLYLSFGSCTPKGSTSFMCSMPSSVLFFHTHECISLNEDLPHFSSSVMSQIIEYKSWMLLHVPNYGSSSKLFWKCTTLCLSIST